MTILVTGPESSGKSTLARNLAWALDGVYVAEAARDYLEERGGVYTEADLPAIWAKQEEAEDAARASSASFVVCDTGPEVIRIWAEVKYGQCPPNLITETKDRPYDLVLLCLPDIPWTFDKLREAPNAEVREALLGQYRSVLKTKQYHEISGEGRLEQALGIIRQRKL